MMSKRITSFLVVATMLVALSAQAQVTKQTFLNDFWEMLVEAGMVGYEDDGGQQKTDVTGENASEPSRARRR